MANFVGHLVTVEQGVASSAASWLSATPFPTVYQGWVISTPLNGALVDNPITPIPQAFTGHLAGGYADIFYNRILLEPVILDLGNVVADQVRQVTVFNGYFITKTLSTITIGGDPTGLILTGDTPPPDVIFTGLQERTYDLSIAVEGPPTVSATYQFIFTDAEDPILTVFGSRIVVLPYYFSAPADETLVWLTNIMTAYDGTEQRVRTRNSPRQQFSARATITIDELNKSDNLFYGWRGRLWALPIWSETRIASPVTNGDTTITVDTLYGDFRVGGLAMIWKGPRDFDVFEVDSFTPTSIISDRGINDDYAAGSVMPVRTGRLLSNPTRSTNGVNGFIGVEFEVIDNITLTSTPATEPFGDGIEVYLEEPLLNPTFIRDNYEQRVDVVDFQTGSLEIFAPWIYTKINREFKLVLEDLEQVWTFREWLHRRAGRAIPFYMPTFENNLRLLNTGTVTNTLEVKDDAITSQASQRIHLGIKLLNGTWLFKTIISSTNNLDGTETIGIDTGIGVDADEIDFISFTGRKRLTSDRMQLRWLSNCVAEVVVPITEVLP